MFGTEYVNHREDFPKDDQPTEVVRAWICDFLTPYMMTTIKKSVALRTKCFYCVRDEILHNPELAGFTSECPENGDKIWRISGACASHRDFVSTMVYATRAGVSFIERAPGHARKQYEA